MISFRPFFGLATPLLLVLSGCHTSENASSQTAVEAASKSAPPTKPASDIVELGPSAPELSQLKVEAVKTLVVPADEVISPAKIELNPNRVAHAVMPIPGRIARVLVKLGDAVKEGQPIVAIESPASAEAESAYLQSETVVRQGELALSKASADLARLTDLFEHDAVAKKEVLSAQTAESLAKNAIEQAQTAKAQAHRRLELLGLEPGKLHQTVTVTAPISGKVMEINVVAGEYHNDNSTALMTIADLSRVWVSSQVAESDVRHCKVGGIAELELIAYPDQTFRARVTRIADSVDADTRTIKVTSELDNPNGLLRPEMFGRLHYAGESAPRSWVPEAAVVEINGKPNVFVDLGKGRFQTIPVELGKRHDDGFLILKGLAAGQKVVTGGAVYLKAAL